MKAFTLLTSFILSCSFQLLSAQAPTNNQCENALLLELNSVCTMVQYTTVDATSEPDSIAANPSCGSFQEGDIWFKFEVPASGNFRIENNDESAGNAYWTLYSGNCGTFEELYCSAGNVNFVEPGLADSMLYLRFFRQNSTDGIDFSLCVHEINPPVNDNCTNALSLPVSADCAVQEFSSFGATAEHDSIAANSCGLYQGGDVWFTFDVPVSGNFRIEIDETTPGNAYWTLYSGTCGTFEQVQCSDGKVNFTESGLSEETLYLRVHRYYSAEGIDFTLCIQEIVPPANNNCADPIALPVGEECAMQEYSSFYATAEHDSIAVNPCGLYQGGDVWFTFDAPVSGNFRIEIESISSGTAYWTIYSGSCGAFEQLHCSNGDVNFTEPTLSNETIYLRVHRYYSAQGIDFSLCIYEIDPPVNNNCANPISLPVGAFCVPQVHSTFYSTSESEVVSNPSCGLYQGGDVWFDFEVPASGDFRIETTNESSGNAYWALYSGSCADFEELACSGGNVNFSEPDWVGDTLTLRFYRYYNTQGIDFSVCIYDLEVPENNHCENAIDIAVSDTCQMEIFSNAGATASLPGLAPDPTCGFYQGGDVWFRFEVPTSGNFRIERNNITGVNAQWALYSGSCGDFTQVSCSQLTGHQNYGYPELAGDSLYMRVYNYNSVSGGSFEFCIWEAPQPPNDFCGNAIHLPVSGDCEMQSYTNSYAPGDEDFPNPGCGFYQGGDVWFTFEVPASGEFQILRNNFEGSSAQWAVYSGTCGEFTELACAQLTNQLNFNDQTLVGDTLYLRVFGYNSSQGGIFELCVRDLAVPENDMCADAIDLPVLLDCTFQEYNSFNGTSEAGVAPDPTCGFYQGGDIWFRFVVPPSGQFLIQRNNVSGGSTNYSLYSGECGNFTELACPETPESAPFFEPGWAGDTLYLRAYRYNNVFGAAFEMCIVEGDCNGDFGGTAFLDNCSDCVGGNTGEVACVADCNGDFGGTAYLDDCEECVGGNTGELPCELCDLELLGSAFAANPGTPDGSASVTVTGGTEPYEYAWNDPLLQNTATATGLFAGSYVVIVTDAADCEAQITLVVPVASSVPNTQVADVFCNTGGYYLSDFISANGVAGADAYRWEFTDSQNNTLPEFTRSDGNKWLRLEWITDIETGETYDVRVKAQVGGTWGEYAAACSIGITPDIPTTELRPNYTPTNAQGNDYALCDFAIAYNISNSQNFRWRFDGNGAFGDAEDIVYTRGTNNPSVRLSWVNGLTPGFIYNVGVEVQVDGTWSGYGTLLPLTLALPPNDVEIRSQFCGGTYAPNGIILSESVCEADLYQFRFTPTGGGTPSFRNSGNYVCFMSAANPSLTPGDYDVQVKVTQNGVPGDWGPVCPITISGPQGQVNETPALRDIEATGSAILFPNPNAGEEVRVNLDDLSDGNHEVMIQVYDVYGKLIINDGFGHEGNSLSRLVRFDGNMATGMYMVQITVDGERFATERMIVK